MLRALLPKSVTRVVVCLRPINKRWGTQKLGAHCRDELHIEPSTRTGFLFVDSRRDMMLLYSLDWDGERTLVKKLEKGSFLLPAPDAEGKPFVVLRPAMLARLFRA